MRFSPTAIPGVILIEPKVFSDDRGCFFESYQRDVFLKNGIRVEFVQDNHVVSSAGTLRGLHFQKPPMTQAKLLRAMRGSVYDVAVDVRRGSPTYGKHVGVTLSAENRKMLYVPEGFAHGYLALEESDVLYKVTNPWAPNLDSGLIWNDPDLKIDWPVPQTAVRLSEKDRQLPRLKDLGPIFQFSS